MEHRDGTSVIKLAPVKKAIHSLGDLWDLMAAANRRYLEFISALDDPTSGGKALEKITDPMAVKGRIYRGINFLSKDDRALLHPGRNPAWISRSLKRLRVHGLIKRVSRTYKHYLTDLGRRAILGGLNPSQRPRGSPEWASEQEMVSSPRFAKGFLPPSPESQDSQAGPAAAFETRTVA